MNLPTPRQIRVLYEVECFTATHGRAPTHRELACTLGVRVSTASKHIHYASKKGLNNGMALTDAGREAVAALLVGGPSAHC